MSPDFIKSCETHQLVKGVITIVKPIRPVDQNDTSKRKDRRDAFAQFTEKNNQLPKLPEQAPAGMTDAGAKWYAELVPELNRAGFTKSLDIFLVVSFCESWAMYKQATADVGEYGITIETARGMTKNPAVNVSNDALQKALSVARQIGLTPTSRSELYAMGGDNKPKNKGGELAAMFNF